MKFIRLKPLHLYQTNSYLLTGDGKSSVLIDAPADAEYILQIVRENGLELQKILLTHGHHDHIGAVGDLVRDTGAEVWIHRLDAPMLESNEANLSQVLGLPPLQEYCSAKTLEDGDNIRLDGLELTVLHTPGHTPGSVCYLTEDLLFSGDTLFAGSVGRTDFPNGSTTKLLQSLQKLSALPGDYSVYPGHGEATTLERERRTNYYMRF